MPTAARRRPVVVTALSALLLGGALAIAPAASADVVPPAVVSPAVVVGADALAMSPPSSGWVFTGSAGRTQDTPVRGLGMWRAGTATAEVDVPEALAGPDGAVLTVTAGADRCDGGARMDVHIDGAFAGGFTVDADHGTYPLPGRLAAGSHRVVVSYQDEHVGETCDRALKVYEVGARAPTQALSRVMTFGPPSLRPSAPDAGMWHDLGGGTAETVLWANASVGRSFSTTGPTAEAQVVVTASGDICDGPAVFDTTVDGRSLGLTTVTARRGTFSATALPAGALADGMHEVRVAFVNDHRTVSCDRNLRLRTVAVVG